MPARFTVIRWSLDPDHEFCDKYALARKVQAELLADHIFDTAYYRSIPADQNKIMVDTRRWYLSRIVRKFKDKQEIGVLNSTVPLGRRESGKAPVGPREVHAHRKDRHNPKDRCCNQHFSIEPI